ncbi:MAG: WalN protein [Deltaproteobacteria bacterium]|nr:WalN protein [Deltaproteobacteria bacterium]
MRIRLKIALYELLVTVSYGGIQTTYWETAKRLSALGHEVHLYGGEGAIRRDLPPEVRILTFPFTERSRFPDLGTRFRKFAERVSFGRHALDSLLRERYDILYIRKPYEFPISLYVRGKTGAKVVYRSGGTEFYPGYRTLASRLDAFLACSRYNAGQIQKHCGLRPEVVYNGVDTGRFAPRARSAAVSTRLGIREGDFVLMGVGRIVGWKGFQFGIRALSLLNRGEIKYVIVGDGDRRKALEKEAADLGVGRQVVFAGPVPASEMPEYYSVADVVLFPTIGDDDAFPNTLCEAMACGKPAIGTMKGGIPEGIVEGETGFLVPPRDAEAIADRTDRFLRAPERVSLMGGRARQRAVDHFSWDVIVARLEEIFLELAGAGKRQRGDGPEAG